MAYDPTLPENNAPIVSAELRSQFQGLNQLIDDRPTLSDVQTAIIADSAGPCLTVAPLAISASDPPTQAELQAVIEKNNELLPHLQRV